MNLIADNGVKKTTYSLPSILMRQEVVAGFVIIKVWNSLDFFVKNIPNYGNYCLNGIGIALLPSTQTEELYMTSI